MANKDRNKRSARKARAAERAVREAAQEAAAPSSQDSAKADKTKVSAVSKGARLGPQDPGTSAQATSGIGAPSTSPAAM